MVNNIKTEKKASIFFSSMEQEIYLKAYLQFFGSILTASKPSRTPVALNNFERKNGRSVCTVT